jgi:hypothetical protein
LRVWVMIVCVDMEISWLIRRKRRDSSRVAVMYIVLPESVPPSNPPIPHTHTHTHTHTHIPTHTSAALRLSATKDAAMIMCIA